MQQAASAPIRTDVVPGIVLFENALPDADALHAALLAEIALSQEYLNFGDRQVPMPRLTAWYGDADATYTYSGLTNQPKPWTPALAALRMRLDARLGTNLNSCLINLYADGRKSIGWHADNEPELRDKIVSVSFGATRTFLLRTGKTGVPFETPLRHGSVLVMTVASQRVYQHSVPKEAASGPRLNLTFRTVA